MTSTRRRFTIGCNAPCDQLVADAATIISDRAQLVWMHENLPAREEVLAKMADVLGGVEP